MLWIRSCRHCGGDLYEVEDIYGRYVHCLQCARYASEAQEKELTQSGELLMAPFRSAHLSMQLTRQEFLKAA